MKKIKIVLNYVLFEESEDDDDIDMDIDVDDYFDNVSGESIGENIAQESTNEIISSLDEADGKKALVQLVDENDVVLKEKEVEIEF